MTYYAVSCLGDALDATREFLLPFDRGVWLRLAVVVFFLSGGSGVGSIPSSLTNTGGGPPPSDVPVDVQPVELVQEHLPLLVGIGVLFALLGIAFAVVGAIMEFVLVDSLRREAVTVRASFREHLRKGLSLFAFQFVLFLAVVAVLGVVGILVAVPALETGGATLALGVLLFAIVAVVAGLAAWLAYLLTANFVVPTMLAEDRGIVSAWRRFWPVLQDNLGQFLVYLVVRFGVMIAVGIAAGTAVGIVAFVLAIPFVLVGGVVFFATGGFTVGTTVVLGVAAVIYVLLVFVAVALVQVPFKTYTRYYELLVLGDVDPALDLVEDRREQVRDSPL